MPSSFGSLPPLSLFALRLLVKNDWATYSIIRTGEDGGVVVIGIGIGIGDAYSAVFGSAEYTIHHYDRSSA